MEWGLVVADNSRLLLFGYGYAIPIVYREEVPGEWMPEAWVQSLRISHLQATRRLSGNLGYSA